MRISELADQAGLPLATVKYYLREGLLPPGRPTAQTQAEYDESHLARLRFLRTLREVGDVSVGQLRDLVAVVEKKGLTVHEVLGAAADAIAPTPPPPGPIREATRVVADAIIERGGWDRVREDTIDRENLAAALEAVVSTSTHQNWNLDQLQPYIDAVNRLAQYEIANLDDSGGHEALMQEMVVGQVVVGEILMTLRRLAEEHYSAERFEPRATKPRKKPR